MSNFPLTKKLLTIFVTIVALVILGSNSQGLFRLLAPATWHGQRSTYALLEENPITTADLHSNLARRNSLINSKPALPNLPEKTISSSTKATAPSANLISYQTTAIFEQYKPEYTMVTIHPSNYGDRYSNDIYGNSLSNPPLVVLHETTNSITSAVNTFTTPHPNDNDQVSYHALIALDGTIVYLLPSGKRAFGAGNSAFESSQGIETVKTNRDLPSSVNNFAYHISLETPPDGWNNHSYHSGYTDSQYKSLAWLIAQSNIPDERITTHENVDLSGNRFDPRSFDFNKFLQILHTYRQPVVEQTSAE